MAFIAFALTQSSIWQVPLGQTLTLGTGVNICLRIQIFPQRHPKNLKLFPSINRKINRVKFLNQFFIDEKVTKCNFTHGMQLNLEVNAVRSHFPTKMMLEIVILKNMFLIYVKIPVFLGKSFWWHFVPPETLPQMPENPKSFPDV